MKKISFLEYALVTVLALVVGMGFLGQAQRNANAHCYERMQEQTVLVTVNDGSGSGVVVERGGQVFVWTANHVIENDPEPVVSKIIRNKRGEKVGETIFQSKVLVRDAERDLAILWTRIPPGFFRAAEFADEAPLLVGTPLAHVGNVLGRDFDGSVSIGVVSQIGVQPSAEQWPWKQPTDQGAFAAFYGGSGGPVFDKDGEVVGILVGGLVGKGYINFVPVREIKKFARQYGVLWAVEKGRVPSEEVLTEMAKPKIVITYSVN